MSNQGLQPSWKSTLQLGCGYQYILNSIRCFSTMFNFTWCSVLEIVCMCFFSNVVITFQASGRFSIRSRRAAGTSMGLEWLLCATRATAEIVAVAMATLAILATLATRATRRDQSQGSRPRGCYNLKSYQNLAVKLCERNDQYQI